MEKKYIDYLKLVGLLAIILAHVYPPSLLFEIRNFDVSLLVFLSGILSVNSLKRSDNNYVTYIKKRALRLVVPHGFFYYSFLFFIVLQGVLINLISF